MKIDGKVKGKNILYRADCKEALQRLIEKDVSVDLIYLDPPFKSDRIYNVFYKGRGGVTSQEKAFSDAWNYGKETQDMLEGFQEYLEKSDVSDEVKIFLKAMLDSLSKLSKHNSLLAYLIYMAERLVLCHQILKETGSIYYHCDPTASHYIKVIMDGIFGDENFRRDITWTMSASSGFKSLVSNYVRGHDVILYYSKTKKVKFNKPYRDYDEKQLKRFSKFDENGRQYKVITKERRIYLDDSKGVAITDVWNDIANFQTIVNSPEIQGYPTQKPEALLDRIIKASSNEGDIVLDPFCGCGTAVASALRLKRKWIGIDISIVAINIIKSRIGTKKDKIKSVEYREFDGNPETRDEYDSFDPFQKQDFLVSRIGGIPSPVHTGDGGVDGKLQIYLGEEEGKEHWGDLIFSVKTGKQRNPEMVRELIGTMDDKKGDMGILIMEAEPTEEMEKVARRKGKLKIKIPNYTILEYDKVQIITASELITMSEQEIRNIRPLSRSEMRAFRKPDTLKI